MTIPLNTPFYTTRGISRNDIDHIIIERGRRGDFCPPQREHSHRYYEIFYLLDGQCHFLLRDTTRPLKGGDLVFIAPGELHHSVYKTGEACEICMLLFKPEFLHLDGIGLPDSFFGNIPVPYQDGFHRLLSLMLQEQANVDRYSEAFMSPYLEVVLLMLLRHCVRMTPDPDMPGTHDAEIQRAVKYIYQNFRHPLTLDEVSAVASLSPTYFSRKFKATIGMGFKEYLNSVRLKHAQTALLTTTGSITDIALEYGFNDSNYFKDLFKRVYGKSPREYRKNPN